MGIITEGRKVQNFSDFTAALLEAGFALSSGNEVYSVIPWRWDETPPYETPVRWHTGDPETDPWEWRMRVLDERTDIAYAKLFFRKSGYITREWAPHFLAVRRGRKDFMDAYGDGIISHTAKRIYEAVAKNGILPLHEIKRIGGFSREDASKFDRALVELQMKMFLTMCGKQQKISQCGEEYGWSSTVFCTTERFYGMDIVESASYISEQEAEEKIKERIYLLNPAADEKKVSKFILG